MEIIPHPVHSKDQNLEQMLQVTMGEGEYRTTITTILPQHYGLGSIALCNGVMVSGGIENCTYFISYSSDIP